MTNQRGEYFPPVQRPDHLMMSHIDPGSRPEAYQPPRPAAVDLEPVMATATLTVTEDKYTVGQQFAPIVVGAARGIWQAIVFAAGITGVALGSGVPDEFIARIALGAFLLGVGGRTAESALFDQFISKTVKRNGG